MKRQEQSWWQPACLWDVTCKWILQHSWLLSQFELHIPVTSTHCRGKSVLFFSGYDSVGVRYPLYSLAWSVLSAMHLSAPSSPLLSPANNFGNNGRTEVALAWCWASELEVWAGAGGLKMAAEYWREVDPSLPHAPPKSAPKQREGWALCNGSISLSCCPPETATSPNPFLRELLLFLTPERLLPEASPVTILHTNLKCLYIRMACCSTESNFFLLLTKSNWDTSRGCQRPHHAETVATSKWKREIPVCLRLF